MNLQPQKPNRRLQIRVGAAEPFPIEIDEEESAEALVRQPSGLRLRLEVNPAIMSNTSTHGFFFITVTIWRGTSSLLTTSPGPPRGLRGAGVGWWMEANFV